MFIERLIDHKVSVFALVIANLSPLIFMVLYNWDLQALLVLYWSENLIIGGYTLLKMAMVNSDQIAGHLGKLFVMPFFLIHYGGFCAVHGLFILTLFGEGDQSALFSGADDWMGPFVFIGLLISVIKGAIAYMPPAMEIPIVLLTLSHGLSFLRNYIGRDEYQETSINAEMFAPYKRIVILHVSVIGLGFLIMIFGASVPMLGSLILGKIALDIVLHVKSHVKRFD